MKKLFKKITAIVMAAAISVSAMVVSSVSVSAAGVFDGAKKMEALEYYSFDLGKANEHNYFKITLKQSGDVTIRYAEGGRYDSGMRYTGDFQCVLYNQNAEKIVHTELGYGGGERTFSDLNKGTYYLDLYTGRGDQFYYKDFYYTFTPDNKPTLSFKMTLKKGDTLQLGALTTNYDGKVKWTSTKKSVATVSSTGKITAKKKGTTTIRAELDNGMYIQIKLTIKK